MSFNYELEEKRTVRMAVNDAIKRAKRDGITGMSYDNLMQVTDNRGVTCPVPDYHRYFEMEAEAAAKQLGFNLYR